MRITLILRMTFNNRFTIRKSEFTWTIMHYVTRIRMNVIVINEYNVLYCHVN